MLSYIIGLTGEIVGLVGWFGFGSVWLLLAGVLLHLIEIFMEWSNMNTGAKTMDIAIFAVGSIIGLFIKAIPWYVGGLLAVLIAGIVMGITGIIAIIGSLH